MNNFPEARILVIDDHQANVDFTLQLLDHAGYKNVKGTADSRLALTLAKEGELDLLLLDLHMPAPNGYEILKQLRCEGCPGQFIPVLVFTADATPEARTRALKAGASDFLTKPGDVQEILLRVRNFLETRRLHLQVCSHVEELELLVEARTVELSTARREALEALARAAEFRDDESGLHPQRVGELSEHIALELGEPQAFASAVRLAAPLHDVGVIGLADTIIYKTGKYSPDDIEAMRWHTVMGARILARCHSPLLVLAREIALNHHEWWDGSGYPNGLEADQIPLAARIVAVADAFDSMTHEKLYRTKKSMDEALTDIRLGAGTQFDPAVAAALGRVILQSDQLAEAA